MRLHVKVYAVKDNGFKLSIGDYVHRDVVTMEQLKDIIVKRYDDLYHRSGHVFDDVAKEEARTHAYALWVACDKMQVINHAGTSKYVLEAWHE